MRQRSTKWRLALGVACLVAGAALGEARADGIEVSTDKGPVVGTRQDDIAAFLGIPYAAPPVGDLRFRPPQPRAPWSAPLQATSFGSPCPQPARLNSPSTNEDCLYLNVYAPLRGHGRRPVMVFLHGGSFTASNGGATPGSPDYRGTQIVEQSGVVVVSINYRLSILGFLAAPALDAENAAHASGNYGLQDQQAALAWVRTNIARFGGDPDNVTIFGESAGGISVLYQLVSPGVAGLFQRAIVESANDGLGVGLTQAEAIYAPVIAALGCGGAADVASCLRALPVATIVNSGLTAGPIIDGQAVPKLPLDAFAAGEFNRVPVISGTNRDEGTYFIAAAARTAGRTLTAQDYHNAIAANFTADAAPRIEAAYPLSAYPTPSQALAAIVTDEFFACPTERVRAALSRHVRVYGYEFAQPDPAYNFPVPPPSDLALGDTHTSELAYVFGHDGSGAPLQGQDRALSEAIIGYWTSLATSSNPNAGPFWPAGPRPPFPGRDRPVWPRYLAARPWLLSLATPIARETDFAQAHRCAFWASLGNPQALIASVPATP